MPTAIKVRVEEGDVSLISANNERWNVGSGARFFVPEIKNCFY